MPAAIVEDAVEVGRIEIVVFIGRDEDVVLLGAQSIHPVGAGQDADVHGDAQHFLELGL
ncbi:hypothetical protein D3C72_1914530 [compost metagenome]